MKYLQHLREPRRSPHDEVGMSIAELSDVGRVLAKWAQFALLCLGTAIIAHAGVIVDFEGLPDNTVLTNQYATQYGITFANSAVINTRVFSSQISLNEFEFPPHSGSNVATDNGGPMTIRFAAPVAAIGGYFTYG